MSDQSRKGGPIPPYEQRVSWVAESGDGRDTRGTRAMGKDSSEGRLTPERIEEYVARGYSSAEKVRAFAARVLKKDAAEGHDGAGGVPRGGAGGVPRGGGGGVREKVKGVSLRSEVEIDDPLIIDGSVFGWVKTRVRLGPDDDAPVLVDTVSFEDLSDGRAEATWAARIGRYTMPFDVADDVGPRARLYDARARAVADAVTIINRCDVLARPVPEARLSHVTPIGPLPRVGWTLAFGKRGCGKSWLTRFLAVQMAAAGVRVAWLDLEDGEGGDQAAQSCTWGLSDDDRARVGENLLRYTSPNLVHARGLAKLKHTIADDGGADYLIVDSVTAAVQDELNTAAAAAGFYERMRSLGVPGGFVVAHQPKSSADDLNATAYGSTVWESIPRLVFHVSIDPGEEEWVKHGGRSKEEAAAPRSTGNPLRQAPVSVDRPLPIHVKAAVSKTNRAVQIGFGAILRVLKRNEDAFVFEHVPLKPPTAAEQDRERRAAWRLALREYLLDGGKKSSNRIIDDVKVGDKMTMTKRNVVLKWLPELVEAGDLAVDDRVAKAQAEGKSGRGLPKLYWWVGE